MQFQLDQSARMGTNKSLTQQSKVESMKEREDTLRQMNWFESANINEKKKNRYPNI